MARNTEGEFEGLDHRVFAGKIDEREGRQVEHAGLVQKLGSVALDCILPPTLGSNECRVSHFVDF
jgi:hypothetical protein